MKYYRYLIILVLNFFYVSALHAQSSVSVGVERLDGFSQFEIGGVIKTAQGSVRAHFPISRLKFPLGVDMVVFGFNRQLDSGRFELSIKQIQQSSNGKLEDSDWLFDPTKLDIYSESDSKADGSMLSIKYQRPFANNTDETKKYFEIGIIFQEFSFKAGNTRQYEYIDLDQAINFGNRVPINPPASIYVPGPTITYKVKYSIPYLAWSGDFQLSPTWNFDARLGYSPIVSAEDEDNHLLRGKISTGDLDGNALFYEMGLSWRANETDKVHINYTKMKIDTDGKQTQVDASRSVATIDETSDSEQDSVKIEYTHYF